MDAQYSLYYRKTETGPHRRAAVYLVYLIVSVPYHGDLIARYSGAGILYRYAHGTSAVALAVGLYHTDLFVLAGIVYGIVYKVIYHLKHHCAVGVNHRLPAGAEADIIPFMAYQLFVSLHDLSYRFRKIKI